MKETATKSTTDNDPIIGDYIQYETETPPFVHDRQIHQRPILGKKPELYGLSYSDIVEYLLWDDAGKTNSVWMDINSYKQFVATFKRLDQSGLIPHHRCIDDRTVQVWLGNTPL